MLRLFSNKGRSNRRRFLLDLLICLIPTYFVLKAIVDEIAHGFASMYVSSAQTKSDIFFYSTLFMLIVLSYTMICANIKRLHDLDKKGYSAFLALIPVVSFVYIIMISCDRGTTGPNSYGPDPLQKNNLEKAV